MEQAKQGLQEPKLGASQELNLAISMNRIRNSHISELDNVLRRVFIKVGLRAANFPTAEESALLGEHIFEQYGNHTTSEIRLAFDMAVAGKLDIDENDVVCYESFSCLYFSKIMNSYRRWAREQIKYIPVEQPVALPIEKQSASESVKFWFNEWKESKTKNYFLFSQFTKVYDVLVANNKINISNLEKINIKIKVKNDLVDSCRNDFERAKMKIAINDDTYIHPHCKKLAVALHFNKLIDIDNF